MRIVVRPLVASTVTPTAVLRVIKFSLLESDTLLSIDETITYSSYSWLVSYVAPHLITIPVMMVVTNSLGRRCIDSERTDTVSPISP